MKKKPFATSSTSKALACAAAIIAVVLAVSCTKPAAGGKGGETGKPVVTVSIPPQAAILEAIAGDKIEINCLTTSGVNPETFDPSVSDLMKVDRSAVWMTVGTLPWEEALGERIATDKGGPGRVDTSAGIALITGTHGHHDHHDHGDGHSHGDADPHTWSSPRNVRIIADNMRAALDSIDPANKQWYDARYKAFAAHVDSLDRALGERLAGARAFSVWHPSLSYFARDYGLEQISVGGENKDVSVGRLRAAIDNAASHGARVVVFQPDIDSRQALSLMQNRDLKRVDFNPMDRDWERQLVVVADAIAKNASR